MTKRVFDGLCVGGVAAGEAHQHYHAVMSITRHGKTTTYYWQDLMTSGMRLTGFWIQQDDTINDAMDRMLTIYRRFYGEDRRTGDVPLPAAAE